MPENRHFHFSLLVAHLYWYCYETICLWGVNIDIVDKILMNFHRTTGMFDNMLYTKLFVLVLMGLSCLGTNSVKHLCPSVFSTLGRRCLVGSCRLVGDDSDFAHRLTVLPDVDSPQVAVLRAAGELHILQLLQVLNRIGIGFGLGNRRDNPYDDDSAADNDDDDVLEPVAPLHPEGHRPAAVVGVETIYSAGTGTSHFACHLDNSLADGVPRGTVVA